MPWCGNQICVLVGFSVIAGCLFTWRLSLTIQEQCPLSIKHFKTPRVYSYNVVGKSEARVGNVFGRIPAVCQHINRRCECEEFTSPRVILAYCIVFGVCFWYKSCAAWCADKLMTGIGFQEAPSGWMPYTRRADVVWSNNFPLRILCSCMCWTNTKKWKIVEEEHLPWRVIFPLSLCFWCSLVYKRQMVSLWRWLALPAKATNLLSSIKLDWQAAERVGLNRVKTTERRRWKGLVIQLDCVRVKRAAAALRIRLFCPTSENAPRSGILQTCYARPTSQVRVSTNFWNSVAAYKDYRVYTTIVHAFCSWLLSAIWTTSLCPESVNLLQDKPETSKAILAFYFMENICFSIWRRKCLFCNVHCRNNPHISTLNSASWCCLLWCALFIFLFCFAIHSEYLVLPAFYASIPTVQNTWLPQKPELNYLQKGMLSHPPSQPETSHTQPW